MSLPKLIQQLTEVYSGSPWYGDSVRQKLDSILPEAAFHKTLPDIHSIAEIVAHMTVWRQAIVEWIRGNEDYQVPLDSEADWNRYETLQAMGWERLRADLDRTQQELISLLQTRTDAFLQETIGPKKYTFGFMLDGIIQHDIYHLGQIGLLLRLQAGDKP